MLFFKTGVRYSGTPFRSMALHPNLKACSKVTGLPLQLVEDTFELLAGDGYVLHDHDSGGHAAEPKAKGRQFLREYARRRRATKDAATTSSVRTILFLAANPRGTPQLRPE